MRISILFGTETGNAEMLAEDLEQILLAAEHEVDCQDLVLTEPNELAGDRLYLIVCSTYGDGELPFSAQPFQERLDAQKPDLSAVKFGMFGLGDMAYAETFNFGPIELARLLKAQGAKQIGEQIAHDASGDDLAEDLIEPWAKAVIEAAAASSEAA